VNASNRKNLVLIRQEERREEQDNIDHLAKPVTKETPWLVCWVAEKVDPKKE